MIALLALHGMVGAVTFATGARLGRRSFLLAAVPLATTLVWLIAHLGAILDGRAVGQSVTWVGALGLDVDLRIDGFGALMVALVTIIGLAVCAYSLHYFEAHGDEPEAEGLGRLAGLLAMFAGAMIGVVVADNLLVLYVAWELTSITSYLLIGNDHTKARARAAALHALLVTAAGGLVMLAGFVLIGQAAGTYRLSAILNDPPAGATVTVGLVFVLIGAFTKSAQYPFHSWLPGAMAAPTPISAFLHSATMVKAGVYLIGRFAPAFATTAGWRPLVVGVGLTTMIAGGLRAMRQYDLKLLLAHGTVSQLGFLVVLFGVGTPAATAAGCVLLVAHALFKAALFMVVGMLDHQTGTRDIRELEPLGRAWRPIVAVACVSAASMAGIPLLVGFIAKEAAYDGMVEGGFAGAPVVLGLAVAGSALTAAYSARFIWGAFVQPHRNNPDQATNEDRPTTGFAVPAMVLAAATLLFGLVPGLLDRLADGASRALDPSTPTTHLAIWHGANVALLLSAITLALGAALFVARRRVSPVLALGGRVPTGTEVYLRMLRGLNNGSTGLTGVVQNGSLPFYAGTILATAAVVPGVVFLSDASWPGWPQVIGSPAEAPIVVVLIGAALAAAIVRRRFSAALFLGTAGYAMAGLFVVQGAPDLALTQAAIETLSTVVFVLVLRRLPDRFERRSTKRRRVVRLGISAMVGIVVFVFAIVARGSRVATPVSEEIIERSLPDGHGRNVVNVLLVDFRGLDTLAEITVLATAAIGAVALARVGRRRSAGAGDSTGARS